MLRAAAAGHPAALFALAIIEIEGPPEGRNIASGVKRLITASTQGHSGATRMLAVLKARGSEAEPDWAGALQLVLRSARGDDAGALRDLALIAEMARAGHALANDLLYRAACLGDAPAAFAVVTRAQRGATHASRSELSTWTQALQRVGYPLAGRLPALPPASPEVRPLAPLPERSWSELQELLVQPPLRSYSATPLHSRPRVAEIKGLLSEEECDFLIGLAAPLARASMVYNNATGTFQRDPIRTASEAPLWASNQTLAVHCLNLRMSAAVGAPPETGEMLNVLKYERGQEFRPHFDFFDNVEMVPDYAQSGQRVRTLLTYLNDDFEGGPTHFLAIDLKYRGRPGDAVLFFNTDEAGAPDRHTLHAGMPVESGVKWLASKWYRERAYG